MADAHVDEVVADFIHELRQPLSALEALTSYLDLVTPAENTLVHEQLRRMHRQIDQANQILKAGFHTLGAYFSMQGGSVEALPAVAPEGVVEGISRPLTSAAMASVTY